MLTKFRETFWFLAIKKVGMVADFAELDQDVFVVSHGVAFFDAGLFKEVSVNTFLELGDAYVDVDLNFRFQRLFNIFLNSSKQEWPHNPM